MPLALIVPIFNKKSHCTQAEECLKLLDPKFRTFLCSCPLRFLLEIGTLKTKGIRKSLISRSRSVHLCPSHTDTTKIQGGIFPNIHNSDFRTCLRFVLKSKENVSQLVSTFDPNQTLGSNYYATIGTIRIRESGISIFLF